ncbi:hypothetical protein K466DRAFT_595221 [Polyporus arcularius HHB13444]|uniref:Uncharacterized protein n=1 Tax=Polyporus arcularius HHB13444 TaxID=1314778 RepID=A0A5C3PTH3_9APHY|nr:hypothetical protein K466DRAFT_595221 [Polyporus arcularius HHB13444]
MQFTTKFTALALALAAATVSQATPSSVPADTSGGIISKDEFMHWLDTTDANITYVGVTDRSALSAADTMVRECSPGVNGPCSGGCSVYNLRGEGGCRPTVLREVECLSATMDILFCQDRGCSTDCTRLSECRPILGPNTCYAYGTKSIDF